MISVINNYNFKTTFGVYFLVSMLGTGLFFTVFLILCYLTREFTGRTESLSSVSWHRIKDKYTTYSLLNDWTVKSIPLQSWRKEQSMKITNIRICWFSCIIRPVHCFCIKWMVNLNKLDVLSHVFFFFVKNIFR